MPWPAFFALGAFTALFFGAPKIVSVIAPSTVDACISCSSGQEMVNDTCIAKCTAGKRRNTVGECIRDFLKRRVEK